VDNVSGESFDSALARGRKPKRPADSDMLLIESDAEPGSGAKRKRPEEELPKPEPFKTVRALAPFQVVYDTVVYRPGDVATVPASLADQWLLNRWCTDGG
jgi:hypothetical protein